MFLARPTAEVLEWLQELFYLINNNGSFVGDGRNLQKIGEDLGLDEASLLTVAARTPQKSALKLFRLLYPTIASRAKCISILKISESVLDNIYREFIYNIFHFFILKLFFIVYVRNLHKNLSFTKEAMRKAIGTSIRNAKLDLRRQHHYEQRTNAIQDQDTVDPDESDEGFDKTIDTDTTHKKTEYIMDECEDIMEDEDENEDNGENESNNDLEDEDSNKEMDSLMIDEEFDDDEDDE